MFAQVSLKSNTQALLALFLLQARYNKIRDPKAL